MARIRFLGAGSTLLAPHVLGNCLCDPSLCAAGIPPVDIARCAQRGRVDLHEFLPLGDKPGDAHGAPSAELFLLAPPCWRPCQYAKRNVT